MKPRQSRQVRKEATVTGRFVRSELPVSGFIVSGFVSGRFLRGASGNFPY
jgi:hypothetical protein